MQKFMKRNESDRKQIAEKLAEESIVLLKNTSQMLPLKKGKMAAFFGRTQIDTLYSGSGSGSAGAEGVGTILEACEERGILAEPVLKGFYKYKFRTEPAVEGFDWTKVQEQGNSGVMYEVFGKYRPPLKEYEVPDTLIAQAAEKTDTAILVIGRNSGGEECDRHMTDDYLLTKAEEKLLEKVCLSFPKVAVVLNVNGLIDLAWTKRYSNVKALLFLGIPGEAGPAALAKILVGEVNPSGKLAVTAAQRYEDYPSARHFSWDKEHLGQVLSYEDYGLSAEENGSVGFVKSPVTVYWEDIYAGYRYFDTFGKQVLYPFGYGLSYTAFAFGSAAAEKECGGILVTAEVKNTGKVPGKEVVQVYLSKVDSANGLERPFQELKGFQKTQLLAPGQTEQIKIRIPWRELAVYEEKKAAWVIEAGDYILRLGNSSRNTAPVGTVHVVETILIKQCDNRLQIAACNRGKVKFLTRRSQNSLCQDTIFPEERSKMQKNPEKVQADTAIFVRPEDVRSFVGTGEEEKRKEPDKGGCGSENRKEPDREGCGSENQKEPDREGCGSENQKEPDKGGCGLENREKSWMQVPEFPKLSTEELASLCVGFGPGTPFAAAGDCTDPSTIFDADGKPLTTNSHPAGYPGYVSSAIEEKGIRSIFYKDGPAGVGGIAWPTEMLLACSFDRKLWELFGDAVGQECEERKVNVWLAPAVNLHRNPLCGRNFEYFSEDPYLTGVCACAVAKGVQDAHPVLVCPKHFAVNEQETFRRGSAARNIDAADSILTERAARELYLKPFEMLIKEGKIACIMTSFNKINGTFAGGSRDLCTHILREEWGFLGAVVTDWGDMDIVTDGADAVAAGNDIVMPGGPPVIRQILKGYQDGRVTREQLELAVRHLLLLLGRAQNQ